MGLKSKTKGKNGEREVVLLLKRLGFDDAERTQQYNGIGKSDVWCPRTLPDVHIEVKRIEGAGFDIGTQRLADACFQAMNDADGKQWCVFWRPNGKKWRLTALAYVVDYGSTLGGSLVATFDEASMAPVLHHLQSNA